MSTDGRENGTDPKGAPADDIVDAEFEEADAPDGQTKTTGEQAIVVADQDVTHRLLTLGDRLKGQVSPEVQEDIALLAEFALATANRLERMKEALETRNRALAVLLTGDQLPSMTAKTEAAEKAPDKLHQLEIETPDSVELVTEKFTITLTNPNGEAVTADVQITLQSFDGKEDPVLECLVNPREGRASGLTQRAITLGPKERREIEVTIRSKFGKQGDPKPEEIIAEQMKIDVKLTPTDVDTKLEARTFPSIQRDTTIDSSPIFKDEIAVQPVKGEYPCSIEMQGVEFRDYHENKYTRSAGASKHGNAWAGDTDTKIVHRYARTVKGYIPLKIDSEVKLHFIEPQPEAR